MDKCIVSYVSLFVYLAWLFEREATLVDFLSQMLCILKQKPILSSIFQRNSHIPNINKQYGLMGIEFFCFDERGIGLLGYMLFGSLLGAPMFYVDSKIEVGCFRVRMQT